MNNGEIEGEAQLTHVLAALPVILSPLPDGEDDPVLELDEVNSSISVGAFSTAD